MNTAAKNRLVMKNTLMLYFRMFLIMAVTLYTSRIVLAALGEVDYGIYNVVAGVVVMMDVINAALYGATIRFMTYVMETGDVDVRKRTFSSIKYVHLMIGLLTLLLGETVGLWFVMYQLNIPEASMVATFWTYQCALAVLFIGEISLPYTALIMAYERMSTFAYISILEALLKLAIAIMIMYSPGNKLIVYSALFLLIQVVLRMTYTFYCNKHFVESKVKMRYNKEDIRQISQFTSWTILGSIAGVGNTQGINILLNIFFGPVVNTARGIAAQVHVACMKFCSNFQVAVKPQIIKSYSTGELKRMHNLVLYSVKLCLFLTLIMVTPIFYFTEPILRFWLIDFPEETVFFVKVILIQQIFYSIGYPLTSAIEATGRIKRYQIIISSTAILSFPTIYLSLKFGHITANMVMVIYLITTIIIETLRILLVLPNIRLGLHCYARRIVLRSILPFLIISTGYYIIPHYTYLSLMQIVAYSAIVVMGTICVLYVFGTDRNERAKVNQILMRTFQRIKSI